MGAVIQEVSRVNLHPLMWAFYLSLCGKLGLFSESLLRGLRFLICKVGIIMPGSNVCGSSLKVIISLFQQVFDSFLLVLSTNCTGNHISVQFSHSVVSNSLRTHELQHARPPCPSPTPGVHSDSCPSSR